MRGWLIAAVVLLSATGCAASSRSGAGQPGEPAAPAAPTPHTVTRTFAAYDGAGRLTVPVAGHRRGYCWSASVAAPGAHAYRCFAGNTILDPCFVEPGPAAPHTVACVADPWSPATVLRLTKRLPAAPDPAAARPWAIVLAGGARCVATAGTVPAVDGINLPYGCSDRTAAALLDRPGALRHAYAAAPTAAAVREVAVRVLWRA